jgi:hypothetical protein
MKRFCERIWWIGGRVPLGYSHDLIEINGEPYLERRIVWLFGLTLRLHRFWRGDNDRHLHNHPWAFVTFPLGNYYEFVLEELESNENGFAEKYRINEVKAWRPHCRPASYYHRVLDPPEPIWTVVVTGPKRNNWGFLVNGKHIYYRDMKDARRTDS